MSEPSRSRPARQPGWRPGTQPESNPARRWLLRLGMTAATLGLAALLVWLYWPRQLEPAAFASIVVAPSDAGQVAGLAFAEQDRALLAALPWTVPPLAADGPLPTAARNTTPEGVFVCYVAGHLAARPVEGETQLCLLSEDFSRIKLPSLYSGGSQPPAISLREVLRSIARQPYATHVVLLDAPRAQSEPWLSIAQADWATTFEQEVKSVEEGDLWVVCAGPASSQARVDHHAGRSVVAGACAKLIREFDEHSPGEPLRLRDLRAHLEQMLGVAPLIATNAKHDLGDRSLPLEFTRRASAMSGDDARAPAEQVAEKPADNGKSDKAAQDAAPKPAADPVWVAHDELEDAQRQLGISPLDYAPAAWRELEQVLVWNDWRRHTGGGADEDAIGDAFQAAKPALSLAEAVQAERFRLEALEPFPGAIASFRAGAESRWMQAPPAYIVAVRQRNLLLSRLPTYWRWRASSGTFDANQCDQELAALTRYCQAILDFESQSDSAQAEEIRRQANALGVEPLLARVTTDLSKEVTGLCARHEGATATALPAATQHAIEQLLLTSLPSAADRQRLWNVLAKVPIESAVGGVTVAMAVSPGVIRDQATLEARLATFTAGLGPGTPANEQALADSASQLQVASTGVNSSAAAATFARLWSDFRVALTDYGRGSPRDAAQERFLRAADAFIERDDSGGGLAPLRAWERHIAVRFRDLEKIDFSSLTDQELTVEVGGVDAADTTLLRFTEIPPEVELMQGATRITRSMDISYLGQPLTFTVRYVAKQPPQGALRLAAVAEVKNSGVSAVLSDEHAIPIQPPGETGFELVRRNNSSLVREVVGDAVAARQASLPGVRLLAYPNLPSTYDLGLRQTSGPQTDVRVELYALRERFSQPVDVPKTFAELEDVADKFNVFVELGPPADVRELKFSLAPPAAPATSAAAPAGAGPPAAEAPQELQLPSLQLVAVITELNPSGKRHLKWLGVEPVHPEQFVQADEANTSSPSGAPRLEFTVGYKGGAGRDEVARPAQDVQLELGLTADLQPSVERIQNGNTPLPARGLTPWIDFQSVPSAHDGALVYFDVSGYPRAFAWRLGEDQDLSGGRLPRFADERIHIRQPRPSEADPDAALPGNLQFVGRPTNPIDVWLETDFSVADRHVEVGLRDANGDRIDWRTLRGARQYRPRLKVDEQGRLTVICEVSDFRVTLLPGGTTGEATIYADLLTSERDAPPTRSDAVHGVLDGEGPEFRDIDPSRSIRLVTKPGAPISVTVTVEDELSGPKKLEYWTPESPVPVIDANNVANPPGKELLPAPLMSAAQSHTVRDFKITFQELAPGDHRIYLRAQDFADNWSKLTSFVIEHRPEMNDESEKKPQPRDVILTVTHKGLGGKQPTRNPTAALVGADGKPGASERGNAQGVVVLKQLPPGAHKVMVSGSPRNAGVVTKEHVVNVPDDGKKTPIREEVSLD